MLLDKFKEEGIHVFSRDLQKETLDEVIEKETFKSFNKDYIDFIDNIKDSGRDFAAYWFSFIEITQVVLYIIFTSQFRNWELVLESLRDFVPYAIPCEKIH